MSSVAPLPSDVASPETAPSKPTTRPRFSARLLSAVSLGAFAVVAGLYLFVLEPYDERSLRAAQERAIANQQKLAPTEAEGAVSGSAVEAKITADPAGPPAPSLR